MAIDRSHIIREFCPSTNGQIAGRVIIRTTYYAHTLDYFLLLFEEAKKDFPEITPEEVEVIHYGGERYARTDGIEFNVKVGTKIPDTYSEVSQVEYIR